MAATSHYIIILLLCIAICIPPSLPRRGRRFRRKLMLSVSNMEKRVEMVTAEHDKCEQLMNPMCKDAVPYNYSMYPNLMGQTSEGEAGMESLQFSPLIKLRCSDILGLFLCLLYHPPCMDYPMTIPPCRELCDESRAGCEHVMNQFGFEWPSNLACEVFPLSGQEGTMCMSPNVPETTTPETTMSEATTPETTTPEATTPETTTPQEGLLAGGSEGVTNVTLVGDLQLKNCRCTCGP